MEIIQPKYSSNNTNYRYPDQITTPVESKKDYFISPLNKNFLFKNSNGETTVNIDFLSLNNAYFNNRIFITI